MCLLEAIDLPHPIILMKIRPKHYLQLRHCSVKLCCTNDHARQEIVKLCTVKKSQVECDTPSFMWTN